MMEEVTLVASVPCNEPAPPPKPRLMGAEVIPALASPAREVMRERSAWESARPRRSDFSSPPAYPTSAGATPQAGP